MWTTVATDTVEFDDLMPVRWGNRGHLQKKRSDHGCIIRTGYWTPRWRLFNRMKISHLAHEPKKFLPSRFSSALCSPLNTGSISCSDWRLYTGVTSQILKSFFQTLGHFYKHKTSIDLKSNTWPYFPFEVSCRQFYRHLFYNGGLWGKCDLGHKGFFMLQYRSYPPGEIDSKAVRWRRIQFS